MLVARHQGRRHKNQDVTLVLGVCPLLNQRSDLTGNAADIEYPFTLAVVKSLIRFTNVVHLNLRNDCCRMDRINENHCAGLTDGAILRGVIATDMEIEFLQQFYGINFTEVLTYGVPWISAVHMLESLKYVTKSPVSYHLSYFASYHHAAVNDEKVRGMFLKELAVSAANCINHAAPRWSVQEIYETIRYDIFTWKGKTSGDFFWRVSINFLYAEKIAKWQQKAGQELALRQIEDDEFEKQRDLTRIGGEGASTCTMELVNRIPERVWPSIQACRRFIGKNFRTDFWGTTMSAPIIQRKQ